MFRTSLVHHQERLVQAVFTRRWYVVIRVLLDTSTCYGWTCRVVRLLPHTKSAHTACKNAREDGPVRSETCRAIICDE